MLKQINLKKKAEWQDYNDRMAHLRIQMGELQRKCKELGIPVTIVFEGFEAAGKGTMINKMIQPLDPRGFQVYTMEKEYEEDLRHPYLWRYHTKMPARGRIHIFDHSWYQGLGDGRLTPEEVRLYEKQFTDDGVVLIKFFLGITKKEQRKRLEALDKDKSTSWRVTKKDWEKNKDYDIWMERFDKMIVQTDTPNAPWTIIEAMDKKYAICKIMTTVTGCLMDAINRKEHGTVRAEYTEPPLTDDLLSGVLQGVDLSLDIEPQEYKDRKKVLQKKLGILHNEMYLKRVPVILAFEGWDAGGKGGAIKRITQSIDPRGYEVVPVASPNDIEKAHHYLWRFWERFPKDGHMAIFDRTWYGRVLVERIEGFATEQEWRRAYAEINNMEANLVSAGAVVLKFWMHIDKDEQAERFRQRQETPEKQWKITDEDWRNRDKWDEYEKAVDEMIVRTSTKDAPWHIIEANSKLYARIKVMEIVVEALEKALKKVK